MHYSILPTRQAAVATECHGTTHLWSTTIRPRDAAASWVALAALLSGWRHLCIAVSTTWYHTISPSS